MAGASVDVRVRRVVCAVSAFAIAAVALDALLTGGLAMGLAHLGGWAERGVAKINPESGEFCCLVHAVKARDSTEEVTPAVVHAMISGKKCPFVDLNCRFMQDNLCLSKESDIDVLFGSPEKKAALEKHYDRWTVPL